MGNARAAIIVTLLAFPLAGCPDRYSNEAKLDLEAPSVPAAIAVSGPRPYPRERLINDREEERKFLSRLLDESADSTFEPQMIRRLRDVMAIKGALSAKFDAADSFAADFDRNVQRLRQEVALAKLRNELLAIEQAEAGKAPGESPSGTFASTKATLERIDALRQALAAEGGGSDKLPPTSTVKADPLETFRMRSAYRAELRSALAAVDVDKLDNFGGNLPYRLELEASVMPGANPNQPAVIDIAIEPPAKVDATALYAAWLGYLTQRLNSPTFAGTIAPDESVMALASASRLFDVQPIDLQHCKTFPNEESLQALKSPPMIYVAVPRGTKLKQDDFCQAEKMDGADCNSAHFVSAALNGLAHRRHWPRPQTDWIGRRLTAFQQRAQAGRTSTLDGPVPDPFRELVAPKADQIAVHRVRPLERQQWMSTSSVSAASLDLALAVSAALAGRGAEGELGTKRDVAGAIETLETNPVVVGYAETTTNSDPRFGWVLPPEVVADHAAKKLVHAHKPRTVSLAADVSLPAWWPGAELPVRTLYGGQAWTTGTIVDGCSDRMLVLRNETQGDASMAALTSYLAGKTMGGTAARARIRSVDPDTVSVCQDTVAFTVRGDNLWRSPQVSVAGVPAKKVSVLPDLGGVRAEVDVKELLKATNHGIRPNGLERARVVFDGEDHGDDWFIKLAGRRAADGSCSGGPSVSDRAIDGAHPAILGVAPNDVALCRGSVRLFVDIRNIAAKDGMMTLAGIPAKVERLDDSSTLGVVTAVFDLTHLAGKLKAPTELPLVYATPKGMATQTVRLQPCPVTAAPKADAPAKAEPEAKKPSKSVIEKQESKKTVEEYH